MILFKIAIGQMVSSSNVKCLSDLSVDSVFFKFVEFVRKQIASNFLANKLKTWFNENGGKNEKELSFRLKRKESFLYMKHFPSLIRMLFLNVSVK